MELRIRRGITGYIVTDHYGKLWGCSTLSEVEIVLQDYFEKDVKTKE